MNPHPNLENNYLDQHDLVAPKSKLSLNGIRYSTEALLWITDKKLKIRIINAVNKCESATSGVWMRTPDNGGAIESIDDYTSLATFSYFFMDGVSQRILAHWEQTDGYFNQFSNFNFRGFLSRFVQLKTHLQWSVYPHTKKRPNIFRRIWWAASILSATRSKNPTAWVLSWQMLIVAPTSFILEDFTRAYFIRKCEAKWPGGIGDALGQYFVDSEHPSAVMLRGQYGQRIRL